MIDVKFATSLQIMLSLALAEDEGVPLLTSHQLASSLGAHAALVRTLMVPLVQNGLVRSLKGKAGGVTLAKAPSDITLAAIYRSSTGEKKLLAARVDIPKKCLVSSNIMSFFDDIADEAEAAILTALSGRTLAGSLEELKRRHQADLILGQSDKKVTASG